MRMAQVAQGTDMARSWHDLLIVIWRDFGIEVRVGLLGIIVIAASVAVSCLVLKMWRRRQLSFLETTSVTIKYGDLVEQEIRPNYDTVKVAYQAWIEITTRKVGLKFDEEHDVIEEIYNSWYILFGVLRDLAKRVPAQRLRTCEDTRNLVDVLHRVMNEGIRPHLTRWQARFRRWYKRAMADEKNRDKMPQEIQRLYPDYSELVSDLKSVNSSFLGFANDLRKLAEGEAQSHRCHGGLS